MSNSQIKKLNNALYVNRIVIANNTIKAIKDINGFQIVELNNKNYLTGKLTMFFNCVFGANAYDIIF